MGGIKIFEIHYPASRGGVLNKRGGGVIYDVYKSSFAIASAMSAIQFVSF